MKIHLIVSRDLSDPVGQQHCVQDAWDEHTTEDNDAGWGEVLARVRKHDYLGIVTIEVPANTLELAFPDPVRVAEVGGEVASDAVS